jgi:bacteriophage HK97-gp10 putative tail-component
VDLAEFGGALRDLADRAETELAPECAREAGTDFLAILRAATPKRTGHLADSESLDSVTGGGSVATAVVGAHAVYAEFREHGGTIRVRNAKVLTDGVSFFGKQVTQRGSRYFEKAEGMARPAIEAACQAKLAEFLTL